MRTRKLMLLAFIVCAMMSVLLFRPISIRQAVQRKDVGVQKVRNLGERNQVNQLYMQISPSESEPKATSTDLSRAQWMMSENNVCGLISEQILDKLTHSSLAELLNTDEMNSEMDSSSITLLSVARDLIVGPPKPNHSVLKDDTFKFYYSLYLGGILSQRSPKALRLAESFSILSDLIRKNPKNGAYAYFRAAIGKKLGHPAEEVRSDFIDASKAPDFDSGVSHLAQSIYGWGLHDSSHYLVATLLIGALPIPDYLSSEKLFLQLIDESDDVFADFAYQFGKNLMALNERGSSRREFVFWMALEFQVGRAIARKAWQKLNPNQPTPGDLAKTYKALLANDRFREPWTKAFTFGNECDRKVLESVLEEEVRDFEDWRAAQR